jgi:hypothetical protein
MYNRGEKEMRWSKANDGIKLSSTNDTQHFLHDVFSERKDKKGKLSNAKTRTQNWWYYDDVGALGFKMYAWELPLISNLSLCFKKTKKCFYFLLWKLEVDLRDVIDIVSSFVYLPPRLKVLFPLHCNEKNKRIGRNVMVILLLSCSQKVTCGFGGSGKTTTPLNPFRNMYTE